ncbi:MAG: hypothetical protein R2819_08915 [Allomuricauda sp.]
MKRLAPIFMSVVLLPLLAIAQQDKKRTTDERRSYVLTDVSFVSDAVFMGRRDSISAPYLLPSIGYYDGSGFYADASLSYLTRSEEGRVDLFLLTAGFRFESKKWEGYFSATKYFYNDKSYAVQSGVTADITGSLGHDFKVFHFSVLASSYFTEEGESDFILGGTVKKLFKTMDGNLHITPSVSLYAGSQNFYQEYYQSNRLGNRKGKGQGGSDIAITEIVVEEAKGFNLLSLGLGLSLDLYHKNFIFSLSPAVAFPQNPSTITTMDAVFEEDLETTFYTTVGISYWFYTSKQKSNP